MQDIQFGESFAEHPLGGNEAVTQALAMMSAIVSINQLSGIAVPCLAWLSSDH